MLLLLMLAPLLSPFGRRLDDGRGTLWEEEAWERVEGLVAADWDRCRMEDSEVFRLRSVDPP